MSIISRAWLSYISESCLFDVLCVNHVIVVLFGGFYLLDESQAVTILKIQNLCCRIKSGLSFDVMQSPSLTDAWCALVFVYLPSREEGIKSLNTSYPCNAAWRVPVWLFPSKEEGIKILNTSNSLTDDGHVLMLVYSPPRKRELNPNCF